MTRNLDSRLTALERKTAEREPVELRLVFWDDLTPAEQAELEAQPKDKHIVMSWAPEDDIRIILDA